MALAPIPQSVLAPLTKSAVFLVLVVEPGKEREARDALADVSGLV